LGFLTGLWPGQLREARNRFQPVPISSNQFPAAFSRKIIWKEYEEYKEYRTHNLVCRVESSSIGRILGVTEGAAVGGEGYPVASPTTALWLAMTGRNGRVTAGCTCEYGLQM